MLASYNGGNQVNVQWDVLFCLSQDYHLLYGDLSQVDLYQPQAAICNLGQGSWGQATSGERNGTTGSGMCSMNIRDNSATCP